MYFNNLDLPACRRNGESEFRKRGYTYTRLYHFGVLSALWTTLTDWVYMKHDPRERGYQRKWVRFFTEFSLFRLTIAKEKFYSML